MAVLPGLHRSPTAPQFLCEIGPIGRSSFCSAAQRASPSRMSDSAVVAGYLHGTTSAVPSRSGESALERIMVNVPELDWRPYRIGASTRITFSVARRSPRHRTRCALSLQKSEPMISIPMLNPGNREAWRSAMSQSSMSCPCVAPRLRKRSYARPAITSWQLFMRSVSGIYLFCKLGVTRQRVRELKRGEFVGRA